MMKRVLFLALTVGIATATITMFQRSESASSDSADVNKIPLKLPLVNPRITVTKSKRQLALYSDEKLVRLYTVGLGFSPKDDKARQGDGCTPEGSFYVCVKNPQSSFYLSLGLSYPNKEHAERGLRDGIITRAQYNRIMSALQRRERPPWDTPLGGEIFIHGNGSQSDWTWGCVALDNDDMKELYDAIPKGTNVVIEP
ncbi:MAG TPA: L,D-transpeptidase [Blastocatellia bacterium]|nr:L,D-transpeptidase [Blastocatellia bacterium]